MTEMDQATARGGYSIWTIILAAGGSARLGRPKQLLRRNAETLLTGTCALASTISGQNVVIVLGAQRLRLQSHLRRNAATGRIVFNRNWRRGLGSSLALAVRALPVTARAALIVLCDQPNIRTASLRRLCRAHREHPRAIIASRYAGRRGVPAILPRTSFRELARLDADAGARDLLNGADPRFRVVTVDMPEAVCDVDTPADAAALALR